MYSLSATTAELVAIWTNLISPDMVILRQPSNSMIEKLFQHQHILHQTADSDMDVPDAPIGQS